MLCPLSHVPRRGRSDPSFGVANPEALGFRDVPEKREIGK